MKGYMYVELSIQMWFRLAKHFLTSLYILRTLIETPSKDWYRYFSFSRSHFKEVFAYKIEYINLISFEKDIFSHYILN